MEVGRIERDTKKLNALYEEGYQEAEKMLAGK
jgi:predicted patatin/cPLA2 family phospholipase